MRIEFRYDAVGRIVEEKQGDCFVIANTYDGVGNRIERRSRFQGCSNDRAYRPLCL